MRRARPDKTVHQSEQLEVTGVFMTLVAFTSADDDDDAPCTRQQRS